MCQLVKTILAINECISVIFEHLTKRIKHTLIIIAMCIALHNILVCVISIIQIVATINGNCEGNSILISFVLLAISFMIFINALFIVRDIYLVKWIIVFEIIGMAKEMKELRSKNDDDDDIKKSYDNWHSEKNERIEIKKSYDTDHLLSNTRNKTGRDKTKQNYLKQKKKKYIQINLKIKKKKIKLITISILQDKNINLNN
eukprot:520436_1